MDLFQIKCKLTKQKKKKKMQIRIVINLIQKVLYFGFFELIHIYLLSIFFANSSLNLCMRPYHMLVPHIQ
jgi:hypothetical protein